MMVSTGICRVFRDLVRAIFQLHAPLCFSVPLIGACVFLGCAGTTHHFLPPRPLEKNEILLSWTWNYDFDQWNFHTLSPAVNVYAGLGNDDNIGAALQFFGITHISYARYFDSDRSSQRFYYVHLNQPIGTVYNGPYFELGGGLTTHKGGIEHMISAGLSLGHGMSYGLIGFMPLEVSQRKDARDFIHIWRLMPTIKYAAMGGDFSASLSYYHGKAKLIYDNISNAVINYQDTILFVPAEMIDSVGLYGQIVRWSDYDIEVDWDYELVESRAIFLKNDSVIFPWSEFYDLIDLDLLATWAPLVWSTYHTCPCPRSFVAGKPFFGGTAHVFEMARTGRDLIVTRFPDCVLNQLRRPKSMWRDISVGAAIMQRE